MAARKKKKKQHRFFWFMIKLQIFLMLLVLGAFGYYYFGGYADEVQQLKRSAVTKVADSDASTFVPSQKLEIYDTEGNLISERKGEKDAQYVSYEDIPKEFVACMISIEDKKYYSHNGVDFRAIMRAAKAVAEARLKKSQATQGASTITMQLAKLMYMEADRTWQYKVEQMFLAMELEKRYSKEKIMEFYLNNIYFANGYYGVEAACKGYFNCELKELDLSQIAFLCAIPNRPSKYDPVTNFDNTIERRNRILSNLMEDGKITKATYYEGINEKIELNRPKKADRSIQNNYIDTYVNACATKALMEQEGFEFQYYFQSDEEKEEYNVQYDEMYAVCQKHLANGGYKIYTSIDMNKQKELQNAIDGNLVSFGEKNDDGIYNMQGAGVCIDNDTGYVVAIVGGRDQDLGTYTLNRAFQSHRQPGSSIKPLIVYTPAFERGYTPDTIVDDHKFEGGPSNASGSYSGKVPLRYAVAKSLNTVAWQVYEELTPEVGLGYLKKMNFTNIVKADYVPATSIGGFTEGVSPLEMAAGFATIQNDGIYRPTTCIKSIIDSEENIVYTAPESSQIVYDKTAARMMTDVMTSVMQEGTGRNLQLDGMPSAGKTGTTNDHKDGWFVGFTRYYTTSIWVGCDYPKSIQELSGSTYPGKIWQEYMNVIHKDLTPMDFLPYAQLSDEFQEQQEQEIEDKQQRREEGQMEIEEEQEQPEEEQPQAGDSQEQEKSPKKKKKNQKENKKPVNVQKASQHAEQQNSSEDADNSSQAETGNSQQNTNDNDTTTVITNTDDSGNVTDEQPVDSQTTPEVTTPEVTPEPEVSDDDAGAADGE